MVYAAGFRDLSDRSTMATVPSTGEEHGVQLEAKKDITGRGRSLEGFCVRRVRARVLLEGLAGRRLDLAGLRVWDSET